MTKTQRKTLFFVNICMYVCMDEWMNESMYCMYVCIDESMYVCMYVCDLSLQGLVSYLPGKAETDKTYTHNSAKFRKNDCTIKARPTSWDKKVPIHSSIPSCNLYVLLISVSLGICSPFQEQRSCWDDEDLTRARLHIASILLACLVSAFLTCKTLWW